MEFGRFLNFPYFVSFNTSNLVLQEVSEKLAVLKLIKKIMKSRIRIKKII